ncbi:MAG: dihydropyrimidinase [bacterium]
MDLIIKNGTVISSKKTIQADICIKDGKITNIIPNNIKKNLVSCIKNGSVKEIDASNKLVMPGGVDVHTHLDMPFMGTFSNDDFETGTIAAAYGGNTSIIDYIIPQQDQSLIEALSIWHKKAENKAVIDYGFHVAIVPPVEKAINELSEMVNQGVTSIKCFLAYKNFLMISDGDLFRLFQEAKKLGILVCIHAENGEIIDLLANQYLQESKIKPIYHALSRPAILEGEAVQRVLKLAELADVPVYFAHLSTKDALREIKRARKKHRIVYAETCPQYLFLTQDKYSEPGFKGAKYVMSPPLREKKHTKYLLKALKKNEIDVIATDHCPFNFSKEKQLGKDDFTKIPNGIPGIETRLPLMFQEMVTERKLSLNEFVEINCTKPAKIFKMPNKGDIEVGMDADIVIWDTDLKWTIKARDLHQNVDYTPFENCKITGKPITVILRGNIIIENNELKAKPGQGKFLKRNIFNKK